MRALSKISYRIFMAMVIVIALFLLATLFPVPGNMSIKIVQSGSMEPAIKTGAIVVVKPQSAYSDGDVITFGKDTKKNIPTTHRIIASKAENGEIIYITKGDANSSPDSAETKKESVIGKVVFSIPYVGYIADFAKKPLGFALLIGLPALYIVYDEVAKISAEVKKIRRKKLSKNMQNDDQ